MSGRAVTRAGMADEAGLPDAVLLAPLTEDTFLHNLHVRYKRDLIYTYVGNALVCVNPCRPLPLYSAELVRSYVSRPPHQLPPHVYAVAAAAYRCVRDSRASQCVVATGESGAGKTEAARLCLQCAVVASSPPAAPPPAARPPPGAPPAAPPPAALPAARLTAAGTLLEAFGNAATLRNHNASRFGKLLDVEFDFRGVPVGGHITHYILEQGRVCGVSAGERNFHVLYQLLAGADAALLKRLKLQRRWERYAVLVAGGRCAAGGGGAGGGAAGGAGGGSPRRTPPPPASAPPEADTQHFAYTKAAMATLGFSGAQCESVMRLLAFVLKLGNVHFEPRPTVGGSIGVHLQHRYELSEACALVGVDEEALAAALGVAGAGTPLDNGDDSSVESEQADSESWEDSWESCQLWEAEGGDAAEWARALRDRLLRAVYGRLFTWLVDTVNEAIKPVEAGARCTLSILDVYGFECLAFNGLERLLINYAAERVQAAVSTSLLRREQEEYLREGLAWQPLGGAGGGAAGGGAEAESGAECVLGALRWCAARRASPGALLQRLRRLAPPTLLVAPPDQFRVSHFGGAVWYSARAVLGADREAAGARGGAALGGARDALLAALFAPALATPSSAWSPARAGVSVSGRQRALVGALVRRLPVTPRLLRCVRADALLRPRRFDAALLRHQIRTQGIMEMALLRRSGWCEWMCARALVARYGLLARGAGGGAGVGAGGGAGGVPGEEDPISAARALLRTLPIPSAEFTYGLTKVFIRSPRTVWELEALRARRVCALAVRVQRAWRARARSHRAAAALQAAWRRRRAKRNLPEQQVCRKRVQGAAGVIWRAWCASARRRYLRALWARLGGGALSPLGAWPAPPQPRLLAAADAALRRLHHAWRCRLYRLRVDQTTRNRMREKVTASILFKERKASYACSVAHPFVGDYVRLRAAGAWRRAAAPADHYVVFADTAARLPRHAAAQPALLVLSTAALVVLEPRTLRARRRVPAHHVWRLSLSPHRDDLLAVHVRPCGAAEGGGAGCLAGERRRGDLVLRTRHVLELATKLFLVVQNAVGAPPHVNIATQFEVNLGQQTMTVTFHCGPVGGAVGGPVGGAEGGEVRLVRRGSALDVLL